MEDYVYVIDYLQKGRGDVPSYKRQPTVYGIGAHQFTLLELIPRPDAQITIGERLYVGKDSKKRNKIEKIKSRIGYAGLTSTAHGELPYVIADIVKDNEERFIRFYNEASGISTRYHALELLPGLGKKTMLEILNERKKKPFETFAEMEERVEFLRAPEKPIAKRIELELSDPDQKYRIFTRSPVGNDEEGSDRRGGNSRGRHSSGGDRHRYR